MLTEKRRPEDDLIEEDGERYEMNVVSKMRESKRKIHLSCQWYHHLAEGNGWFVGRKLTSRNSFLM